MNEGEYIAVILMAGMFLFVVGLAGAVGVWIVRDRRNKKHQQVFFASIDDKRARQQKRFRQNMARRHGS